MGRRRRDVCIVVVMTAALSGLSMLGCGKGEASDREEILEEDDLSHGEEVESDGDSPGGGESESDEEGGEEAEEAESGEEEGEQEEEASQEVWAWSQESTDDLDFYLYSPGPSLTEERSLMISLHGCSQTNKDLRDHGGWEEAAKAQGMIVALPAVPKGGVYLGCWDYYGDDHRRTNRHNGPLLGLVEELLETEGLGIDADRVYVSGISSGGSQAMVLGCLAPDVFSGVGLNAAPTVGTGVMSVGFVATNEASARSTCRELAGDMASHFETQLVSVIYGEHDYSIAQGYNGLNADVMASIYGATLGNASNLQGLEGLNTAGTKWLYDDGQGPRVSLIENGGVGHQWPAGTGVGGNYITANSIKYPRYVAGFFAENHRR